MSKEKVMLRERKEAFNKKTSKTAYLTKIAEIQSLMNEIQERVDNHFGDDPETINWGHVGNLEHIKNELEDIADFTCKG